MPPKRMKTNGAEGFNNNDNELEVTSTNRKKAQPKVKHEAIILAVDVGNTSAFQSVPDEMETDLQRSVMIVDWIISRKIFTESTDQFSLLFFGHECTSEDDYPNIYLHNNEFENAHIEWLRMLKNEVQSNPKCSGDYVSALFAALDTMKIHAENLKKGELLGATITIISNFAGLDDEEQAMRDFEVLVNAFKNLLVDLIIIGPDLSEDPKTKSEKIGYNFARQLLTQLRSSNIAASSVNFSEGLSKLKFFIPKTIAQRGQPFNFQLGKDLAIPVQLYIKNLETTLKLSFNPVSTSTELNEENAEQRQNLQQLKKVRRYETVSDSGHDITFASIDQAPDTAFSNHSTGIPTGRFLEKDKIIRGYRYGSTLATFNKEMLELTDFPREGKQLQLIQFTRKENILPQFIVSNCRYILPAKDNIAAHKTMSALIQAMLSENVVAICRYAYNINSNPRLACLIPKFTKEENYPVLVHYLMPFRDDFRYYDFPPILSMATEAVAVSEYQMDLMDDYINHLMLSTDDGGDEILKKRDLHDPRIQFQCMTLREKALTQDNSAEITAEDRQNLLGLLSTPKRLVSNLSEIMDEVKKAFPLELDPKTRMAAFNRSTKEMTSCQVDDLLRPILEKLESKKMDKIDVDDMTQ